jgi:hypothetical protein
VPVAAPTTAAGIHLPPARGSLTTRLFAELCEEPHDLAWIPEADMADATDDDRQLALYCCYELHYGGFVGVDDGWEWEPSLLGVRAVLERWFEDGLREQVGPVHSHPEVAVDQLWELARAPGAPSLSGWMTASGELEHVRELAIHRSAYQLKEADPHSWGIPRVSGEAKAALVAIQADEYGNGDPAGMHAALFGDTMEGLGLDRHPNAYLAAIPGVTLATTNLISMLGLHRRLRGALLGHLALFEMTSIGPMARYDAVLRRLGLPSAARRFYQVHVEADAGHQHLAADRMVGGLLRGEPGLASDVVFGARALSAVEGDFSQHLLSHWEVGRTSLRADPPSCVGHEAVA